jgi:hypothetical protein
VVDKPQSKKLAAARAELEELRRRVEELEAQLEASAGAEDSGPEPDETSRRVVHGGWMVVPPYIEKHAAE